MLEYFLCCNQLAASIWIVSDLLSCMHFRKLAQQSEHWDVCHCCRNHSQAKTCEPARVPTGASKNSTLPQEMTHCYNSQCIASVCQCILKNSFNFFPFTQTGFQNLFWTYTLESQWLPVVIHNLMVLLAFAADVQFEGKMWQSRNLGTDTYAFSNWYFILQVVWCTHVPIYVYQIYCGLFLAIHLYMPRLLPNKACYYNEYNQFNILTRKGE